MADNAKKVMGYKLGQKLGFGAFSWAMKGYKEEVDRWAALKFTKHSDGSDRAKQRQLTEIMTELKVFESVRHENVVCLYEFKEEVDYTHDNGKTDKCFCMALELCEAGELFDIVYYTGKLDEKLARTMFRQIAHGIRALHNANLAHRDIKPQNVLLTSDFVIKIADFGSSKQFNQQHLMRTNRVGTRGYQAPELLLGRGYTKKCDIFALGVLLFVCLTKHPPFKNAVAEDQWFRQIAKKAFEEFWRKHPKDHLSPECADMICNMFCYQPLDRLDIEAVISHPWFNGDIYNKDELQPIMDKRWAEASKARKFDKARAPENYDSMTHRAVGGPIMPPAVGFGRAHYCLKTQQHPVVINHGLQKNFEIKNRWKAILDDANCKLELEATMKLDEDDWAYVEGEPNLVTVVAEVQGYVEKEGEFPADWDADSHTGTFLIDVRIKSEFCEPANVVYNTILNYLGAGHLEEDEESDSESGDDE